MTVKELIEELKAYPDKYDIVFEVKKPEFFVNALPFKNIEHCAEKKKIIVVLGERE